MIFSVSSHSELKRIFAAAAVTMGLVLAAPIAPVRAQAPAAEVHAKGDITGDWQGTLHAGKDLRIILKIAKGDKGLVVKMYSIDQGTPAIPASSATLDGSSFKCEVATIGGSYAGTVNSDGSSIVGNWTQGGGSLPFTLVRATKETAWEIPAPKAAPKPMAADANPSFDVATIKPNDSGGSTLRGLGFSGRSFATNNSSLADLIAFAYQVQAKQITGPDWITKDRYDISAIPDQEGVPSIPQMRTMLQKLMADRFKLTFHHDKRDMSAFVMTVAKGGPKLTPTEDKGPGPGVGFVPAKNGLNFIVHNGSIPALAAVMQMVVLDRPVVDQTGIQGSYDISMIFTPDDSQFNGHPPPIKKADDVEAAPSFFEAMQQQLGLKLDAQKTAVDIITIDHVEKPTAN